ncbi:MAG: hypothetical protein NW224_12725 [Leptolyngbyaceae cyanobacterium bins.302]|nr:hypothetical protein [Leptolyngbyaceae cyanobacterium bins.302]
MTIPTNSQDAVYRLRSFQSGMVTDRSPALEFLQRRLLTYRLLELYQTFFPQKFASSRASVYPKYRDEDETHSDRDLEFFKWLEQKLPVSWWMIDRAEDCLLPRFPLVDMGIDWREEGAIEVLKPEWKVLLPLTRDGRYWLQSVDPDGREWYETETDIGLDAIQHPDRVSLKHLRRHCNSLISPLKFLPMALAVLEKATGNLWLDVTNNEAFYGYECETTLPWTADSLRYLEREWHRASRYLSLCQEFFGWLNQDLTPRFQKVLDLWNQPYPKP